MTTWKEISRINERFSIWNGSFATLSMSIVNGFVAMYLLDGLQATNAEMGMLNSLPSLVNLFAMLAAAIALGKARSKKWFCVTATTISRTFYVWIALVPFLPLPNAALWVVWLVAFTRAPQSFGDLSWQALIGDLIPPERRSAFFSERNRMMTIVGLVVTFITGFVLQQFNKHDTRPYQVAFLVTIIFAALEIWFLIRHDEKSAMTPPNEGVPQRISRLGLGQVKSMLRNRRFVWAAVGMLFFNFGWQMSWPLFNIFQIQNAHAPAFWMGLFTVANQLTQILTYRWWGRMAERFGTGRMMAIAAFGMALAPVATILSTNLYYLVFVNILTGLPVAGTTLLLFNYLLEVSPEAERTAYISFYNVVLSLIGFVAPEVGIWLLGSFGMAFGMITSTVIRFTGGLFFLWIAQMMTARGRQVATNSVNT